MLSLVQGLQSLLHLQIELLNLPQILSLLVHRVVELSHFFPLMLFQQVDLNQTLPSSVPVDLDQLFESVGFALKQALFEGVLLFLFRLSLQQHFLRSRALFLIQLIYHAENFLFFVVDFEQVLGDSEGIVLLQVLLARHVHDLLQVLTEIQTRIGPRLDSHLGVVSAESSLQQGLLSADERVPVLVQHLFGLDFLFTAELLENPQQLIVVVEVGLLQVLHVSMQVAEVSRSCLHVMVAGLMETLKKNGAVVAEV